MGNGVGIREVAQRSGVSITTVSHAFSGRGQVSESTRQRVFEAARDLGYSPDPVARAMRSASRGVLGFISEEVATLPYSGEIVRGAQSVVSQHGFMLMMINVEEHSSDDPQIPQLLAQRVDAVIYAAAHHREVILPDCLDPDRTVLVDAFTPTQNVVSVVPNETQMATLAVNKLIDTGHKRIAHITVTSPNPASRERRRAYEAAMLRAGLEPITYASELDSSAEAGRDAATRLFEDHKPSAIFAFSDRLAMGVYQVARELGLSIPGDLSVVGVDNMPFVADAVLPGLTTVQLPHEEMGRRAAEIALSIVRRDADRQQGTEAIKGWLVERDSVKHQ